MDILGYDVPAGPISSSIQAIFLIANLLSDDDLNAIMKRYKQLMKDTWWLWLLFLVASTVAICYASVLFVIMYPTCVAIFVYFGFIRYDDEGNPRSE